MNQNKLFSIAERHLPSVYIEGYRPPVHFPDISKSKFISLDLETFDPGIIDGKGNGPRRGGYIVGAGIALDDGTKEYYPIAHKEGPNCPKALDWLRDSLAFYKGTIVGANVGLYDGDYLYKEKIFAPFAKWYDVQWAAALLDEYAYSYALDVLAAKYGFSGKVSLEQKYGPNWKEYICETHPADARDYVLRDIELPIQIRDKQLVELKKEELVDLMGIESRLTPLLLYMKNKGVRVDLERANELLGIVSKEYKDTQAIVNKEAGMEVDIYSNSDIALACQMLGIKYELTEKGNPTFRKPASMDEMKWIELQPHSFLKNLYTSRMYDRICTFITGYILEGNINGRIHASFHPLRKADDEGTRGTVTGRFSSSDPNLQNIPVRTKLGKEIRGCFIPEENCSFWDADYNQIEFRLLVHFSSLLNLPGAEEAVKAYHKEKADFHSFVMELTGLERKPAKNINFGLIYMMGIRKLAETLGVNLDEAERLNNIYNEKIPFARKMAQTAMNVMRERGYIRTILKRRARLEIKGDRDYSYKALNKLLQGSAADIFKLSAINLWESGIIGKEVDLQLLVHDEKAGSINNNNLGRMKEIKDIMENAYPLKVPLTIEYGIGKNWLDAKHD